jgi:hypothetical protein
MRTLTAVVLFTSSVACTGNIGAAGRSSATGDEPSPPSLPGSGGTAGMTRAAGAGGVVAEPPRDCRKDVWSEPLPMRHLTRGEYDNTVLDLLGDATTPASRLLPADARGTGFDTDAVGNDVTMPGLRTLELLAEDVAGRASAAAPTLLACTAAEAERACAERFVRGFGARAFRRPLADDEAAELLATFDAGRTEAGTLAGAVKAVLERVLQSPDFLYLFESLQDAKPAGDPRVVRLPGWQIAARLSYFLWRTTPDEALAAAARAGELDTPDGVAAQVDRLLASPRARAAVSDFHRQWLRTDDVLSLQKDAAAAPWFAAVRPAITAETTTFVDRVLWDERGGLGELLTSAHSYLSAELANVYGAGADAPKAPMQARVELDPTQRAGMLTQASFLASAARANDSAPVKRGAFVLDRLLCAELAPPPVAVDPNVAPSPAAKTTRDLFTSHSTDPACRGCHGVIDPIGFAFEGYDGLGRWRTTENGAPVDAHGEVRIGDEVVAVDGAPALARGLAGSAQVRSCVVRQWFRYAFGRAATDDDRCLVGSLEAAFATGDVTALVRAVATSEAFVLRRTP